MNAAKIHFISIQSEESAEVFTKGREQHVIAVVNCCAGHALCITWVQTHPCRGEVAVYCVIPFPVQYHQL